MLTVIIGGSGSGKSELAENYVLGFGEKKNYYIATMHPFGSEGEARVQRHRKLRKGKPFETIECFHDAGSLILPQKGAVLLECLSNLTANEMFSGEQAKDSREVTEKIVNGVKQLKKKLNHLVIVSNNVFTDGDNYDQDVIRYIDYIARVNNAIAAMSDQVVEVVCGIPIYQKGSSELQ